ncbi:hypothetical protein ACFUTR_11580 [Streptomyces sp. NPDC057367]|uniref:hypothetical protein n=1 Tax=Streptomyces sp. NPDC057367 TaxID=3346108 RepID=UPI003629CCE6
MSDEEKADEDVPTRKRDMTGLVLYLVVGVPVLVLAIGSMRWFSRHIAPVVYDVPGGSWAVGAALGVLSLVGWAGVVPGRFDGQARPSGPARVVWVVTRVACVAAVLAPVSFLISGLPGKNCRSYEPGCAYIPGAGSAVLAYVAVAGGVGWLFYRWRRAVIEERRARERECLRKLRKKGKGKSRRAAARR